MPLDESGAQENEYQALLAEIQKFSPTDQKIVNEYNEVVFWGSLEFLSFAIAGMNWINNQQRQSPLTDDVKKAMLELYVRKENALSLNKALLTSNQKLQNTVNRFVQNLQDILNPPKS